MYYRVTPWKKVSRNADQYRRFSLRYTPLDRYCRRDERVQAEGLSFVDDLRWVATGKDVNQVVKQLQACAAENIEWASRRDLQFDTAKTEAALFTCRKRHKKHLRPKLIDTIEIGNGFV